MLLHRRLLTTGAAVELHQNQAGYSLAIWINDDMVCFPATTREHAESQFNAAVAEIYRQHDAA